MTNRRPPTKSNSNGILIVAALIIGVVVIVCCTLMAIAIDDGARAASMIALVLGPLATLLAFFGLFVNVQNMREELGEVKGQTTDLTNGLGDAKMRAAVADVLHDNLVDPAMLPQLVRDRAKRELHGATAAEAAAKLVEPHADLD